MADIHIINLKDDNHKGDDNNAKAVTTATMNMLSNKKTIHTTIHIDEVVAFVDLNKSDVNTKFIFIGAGEQSLESLSVAKEGLKDCNTIFSSHQKYDAILEHEHNLDKIALPLTENINLKDPSKRIGTLGVPNEIKIEDVLKKYNDKQAEVISSDNGYIMTVMGGDANNPELEVTENNPHQIEFYEVEEAIKLAEYLTKVYKKTNKKLLITNGPRTGKHNILTGRETRSHRDDMPTDPCSQALLDTLADNGLEEGKDFQFADFRFKPEGGVDSAYMPFLGAALSQKDNSLILMAGESTSMLTDCLNLGIDLASFENNAMNESHDKFFKMLSNNDFMTGVNKAFEAVIKTDEYKINPSEYIRAEEQIAQEIVDMSVPPYKSKLKHQFTF